MNAPRVDLHLRIRVEPDRRDELLRFLAGAIDHYEAPGGITVRLLERDGAPGEFIELVEYKDERAYQTDQARVGAEPRMMALLEQWRRTLASPPAIEVYRDVTRQVPRQPPEFPAIRTPRLVLRAFRLEDAPRIAELANDRRVSDGVISLPHPYTLSDAQTWLAGQGPAHLAGRERVGAITLAHDQECGRGGELIGAVGVHASLQHRHAEMGYWLGHAYWGRGYATEAARGILDVGFRDMGLNRIYARHYARNPQSGRVMIKLGMVYEGRSAQHVLKNGEFLDVLNYAMIRDQWERLANSISAATEPRP